MLSFQMPSQVPPPVAYARKTSKWPASSRNAASAGAEISLTFMTFLMAQKVLRKRERNILDRAGGCKALEWFEVVFLVATVWQISIWSRYLVG
jgi:hypothetical protein